MNKDRFYGVRSESQDESAWVPSGPSVLNEISREESDLVRFTQFLSVLKKCTIMLMMNHSSGVPLIHGALRDRERLEGR